MTEHSFDLLEKIVEEVEGPPDWFFELKGTGLVRTLMITIHGTDNYDRTQTFTVGHPHPVPIATYNEKTWRRWIFEQCMRSFTHELGESLRFGPDGERPFAPMHGPGEDPYTVHEVRPEIDALTTQNGSVRAGPV